MITGTYGWSLISQTSNPCVSEVEVPRFSGNFNLVGDEVIRAGQRLDLLNVAHDARRAKIVKMILNHQTAKNRHSYVMVNPDPRFPSKGREVPFPSIAGTEPHISENNGYRTTFLRYVDKIYKFFVNLAIGKW